MIPMGQQGPIPFEADQAMERLVRTVLTRKTPVRLVIILAVCQVHGWGACENIHRGTGDHYSSNGVIQLSLYKDGANLSRAKPYFNG